MAEPDIIHIGYHKTATTWLQRDVFPRVRGAQFVGSDYARGVLLPGSAFTFDPDRARAALGPRQGRLILSHEGLVGHYINGGMLGALSREMAHRLRATFPDAHVLIVIRSQPEMIASTYVQYLRMGGRSPLAHWLFPERHDRRYRKYPLKCPAFLLDHFAYGHLIEHYRQVFGPERVHVRLYEALRTDPQAFLDGLCRDLGLELDGEAIPSRSRNRALGTRLLPVARALNALRADDLDGRSGGLPVLPRKGVKRLLEGLNHVPLLRGAPVTPETLMDRELRSTLHARFAGHNRDLATRLGLPLRDHGYPMPGTEDAPGDARGLAAE